VNLLGMRWEDIRPRSTLGERISKDCRKAARLPFTCRRYMSTAAFTET